MKITYRWLSVLGILFVISLALTIKLPFLQSLRIVFGSFYVLFLPGHFLTYAFFPKKDIDFIERLTLSFALSIAIVPLVIFYLNLIGMKINLINSFLTILAIITLTVIFLVYKNRKA